MNLERLANLIREARESRRLTVEQVGRACGKGEVVFAESGKGAAPSTRREISRELPLDYTELLILAGHLTEQDVDRYVERRAA